MKASQKLLAAMLTLGLASHTFALTQIDITGAQAFGNTVLTAIKNKLAASGSGYIYTYTGSTLSKAQQSIWHGYIDLGSPGSPSLEEVILRTSWNGSTAGIQLVANQSATVPFLVTDYVTNSSYPGYATSGGTSVTSGITTINAAAQAAPADTTADTVGIASDGSDPSYPYAIGDDVVGAGGYVFVASKNAPITNIAAHQARALYRNGKEPLAFFTGNSADRAGTPTSSAYIYATGRDASSGARIISLLEIGIGSNGLGTAGGPDAIQQYTYDPLAGARVLYSPATDGNTSNGTLATTVLADGSTLSKFNGYYVSYLPSLDAANAVGAGAVALTFNGVAYSADALINGAYPVWAYEHLFRLADGSLSGNQDAVLDAIADQLHDYDATVLVGSLYVTRDSDGGYITPTY